MALKPSTPAPVLVYGGTDEMMIHLGGGNYARITPGCPVPDGLDPATLGPDWVPTTAVQTAPTTTEEV